jgi:hypothetical protein
MTLTNEISRTHAIAGNVLMFVSGLGLVLTSATKFFGVPAVMHQMALEGISGDKLVIVATLELLSALLFLHPKTRSFGLMFLSAFLGGAISTHVLMGAFPAAVPAGSFLTLAWLGTFLRYPEALWSFRQRDTRIEPLSTELKQTTDRLTA